MEHQLVEYLFYWLMNFFFRVGQRAVDFIISNNHPFILNINIIGYANILYYKDIKIE
jgi:hypothetical protein